VYLVRSVRPSMEAVDKTPPLSSFNRGVPTAPMEPIVPRGIVYMYTYTSASIHSHLYPRIHPHMCACIHLFTQNHAHTRTRTHAYMNTHVYTNKSKVTYIYSCAHTQTHVTYFSTCPCSFRVAVSRFCLG